MSSHNLVGKVCTQRGTLKPFSVIREIIMNW